MAILHMDDFAGYGNARGSLMLSGVYAGLNLTSVGGDGQFSFPLDPDGITNKRCLRFQNSGQNVTSIIRKPLQQPKTTIGAMTRVWFDALPVNGANYPMVLMGENVESIFMLDVSGSGRIRIRGGNERLGRQPVIYQSDGPVITATGWWHIEWKTVISPIAGSFEVRVEGLPVPGLVHSNINTGTQPVLQFGFGQGGEGGGFGFDHYQKDLVVWDNEGNDVNDFIGTALIHRHQLVDDISSDWTFTGGQDGAQILNTAPPSPASFINASHDNVPAIYRASISPLPERTTRVRGIQVRTMAAKNDGGDAGLQSGIVAGYQAGEEVFEGQDRPLTVAQLYYDDYCTRNPKTNAEWLPSEVDDALVQLKRTR